MYHVHVSTIHGGSEVVRKTYTAISNDLCNLSGSVWITIATIIFSET